jgi:hypothetical protein
MNRENTFFKHGHIYALVVLLILTAAAGVLYHRFPRARRTFIFYGQSGEVFGSRLIGKASEETDLRRYIEEALLGPESVENTPLFAPGTRLFSFIYSDGDVYAGFTPLAAMPAGLFAGKTAGGTGGSLLPDSFQILRDGIKRNFPAVREVKFFVHGEPIANEFM